MTDFPFRLPMILDGATGTRLMTKGLPKNECAELWNIAHPEALSEIQRAYVKAGSDAVYAATFNANRQQLKAYGLENDVARINRELVAITRNAVGNSALVGGDMSITGLFIKPYGEATFDQLVEIYREQGEALVLAGVDFIGFETMMSLWECRAGLIATRDLGVPVFVSITVDASGRTLMGASLPSCVVTLQALGAAAVGVNCSEGPSGLDELFYRAAVCARVPLIAKPNAGKPDPNDASRFDLDCDGFLREMLPIAKAGATVLGGCCGTDERHIAGLKAMPVNTNIRHDEAEVCANEGNVFFLPEALSDLRFSAPLTCSWALEDDLIDLEDERIDAVLVRVDTPEEADILSEAVPMARLPIAILSDSEEALDRALKLFHGRALVDSQSLLPPETLQRLAKHYGALIC